MRRAQFSRTFFLFAALLLPSCSSQQSKVSPTSQPVGLRDNFLDHLIGDWNLTRSIRGATVHNRVSARWILGHQFVRLDMTDAAQQPSYEAMLIIGYDPAKSRYILHWCDTFGGAGSTDGFGVRQGDSVEFRFEYPTGPFFNTFTWFPPS